MHDLINGSMYSVCLQSFLRSISTPKLELMFQFQDNIQV